MGLAITSLVLGFFSFIVTFSKSLIASIISFSSNLEALLTYKLILIGLYVIAGIVISILLIINLKRQRKEVNNGLITSSFIISIITLVLLILEIFVFIMLLYAVDEMGYRAIMQIFKTFNNILKITGYSFIAIGVLNILYQKNILSNNSSINIKQPKEKVNNKNDEKLIDLYIEDIEGYEKLVKAGIIEKFQDERIREMAVSKKEEKEKRSIKNLYENDKNLFLDMVEIDFFSKEEIKSFEEEMGKKLSEIVEELKAEK